MGKKRNKYAGDQGPGYVPDGLAAYLGLGRPLRIYEGATRLAVMGSIAAGAIGCAWTMYKGAGAGDGFMAALGAALCFFFSYVAAQELDPDRPMGGVVGGVLALLTTVYYGEGNMLCMLWLIFILRMLSRTSGDRHRIGDNILLIGCALWLGYDGLWAYPVLTGVAYVIESQIKGGYFRSLYLAGIAFASLLLSEIEFKPYDIHLEYFMVIASAIVLFLPELRMALLTQFKAEKTGRNIDGKRLQVAQIYFILVAITVVLLHGEGQAVALMPATMAAMGCGIYLVFDLAQQKKSRK